MPQDSLKSAVYRSFVKCDDPKGVAECTTMRKSKTISQSSEAVSKTKTISSSSNPSPENKGKKIDFITIPNQESFSSSLLHLKEVSEGAQNLNEVIDTYSNGMRFDHNSKQIAKDLLKGALDLQESLLVLGKLQEASHYMAKFQKKPKANMKSENQEKTWIKRSKSDRYTDYSHQTGFQKPRFSVDGSSRDCYDELRTVIRDSLARQNLLPPNFHEKTNISEGKMLDSVVDIPSTCSTQSSTTNFIGFTSSDTSFSSDSTKRSIGSNLIAKLMGLEEIPSQQVLISSPKRFEMEKFPIQKRPKIDTTKEKKSQLGVEKEDTEEKKLREIVETMRFKGLLKGNSSGAQSNYSNYNNNKRLEEIETTRYKGKSNQVLRAQSNYSDSNNGKKVLIEDGPPIVLMKPMNMSRVEPEENDSQKLVRKSRTKDTNRGAVDFDEVCRRLRGEVTPVKKQEFKQKELSNKEFKEKVLSEKLKALGSVDQKEKNKRLDRVDKVSEPKKKLEEMQNFKSKTASTSRDQAKVNSMKEKKTEKEPISSRRGVSPQKSNLPVSVSKNKSPFSQKGRDRKKNQNLDKEPLADSLNEEDVELKHGETLIDQSCEGESDKSSTSSSTAAQLLTKEETDAHADQIQEQLENTKSETIVKSNEEASCLNNDNSATEKKCFENQTKENNFFISSPLFLNYAEELFDMKAIQPQPVISNTPEIADTRLLLDVATELMLQKKLSTQSPRPPFLTPPNSLKISLSLTQLVDEVCKGIEDFSKYSENGTEKLIAESLYSVLERDLLRMGLANGAWELGWRHGYGFDDVEKVVSDIENQVLDELIEGVFSGVPQLAS